MTSKIFWFTHFLVKMCSSFYSFSKSKSSKENTDLILMKKAICFGHISKILLTSKICWFTHFLVRMCSNFSSFTKSKSSKENTDLILMKKATYFTYIICFGHISEILLTSKICKFTHFLVRMCSSFSSFTKSKSSKKKYRFNIDEEGYIFTILFWIIILLFVLIYYI